MQCLPLFPAVMLTLPLLLWILRLVVSFCWWGWGCFSKLSASEVLHWEENDVCVEGFFFFALGSTWGHFSCLLTSFQTCLFLHWFAVTHYIRIWHVWYSSHTGYYFFLLFMTPKSSFGHPHVYISLGDHGWAIYRHGASSVYSLCPISCSPPCCILHLCFSRPLLSYQACIFLRHIIVLEL